MENCNRRCVLRSSVLFTISGLAGCSALLDEEPSSDRPYERLQRMAVYVEDDVGLGVPDEVQIVDATNNADLVVLAGGTDVGAERAVEWLADDRVLALVGADAEATWLEWARSDAYEDAFGGDGAGDAEPDPFLLVAAAVGTNTPTYRRSWSDEPRDRDVLRALDESLADVESRGTDRLGGLRPGIGTLGE